MFVLRNVGKLIFGGSGSAESVLEIPQGQLYLVRPVSPKGYSELIFKDSIVQIRRTSQDFNYQLVIQRAYEEGEAELLEEQEGDQDEDDALAAERDEKTFLLDESLHFRVENRPGSEKVLCWRDLNGDAGDVYEFVCDPTVQSSLVNTFDRTARQCQYERKYRKPHTTATEEELSQFEFDEQPIPPASPIHSPTITRSIASLDEELDDDMYSTNSAAKRSATSRGKAPAHDASLHEERDDSLDPDVEDDPPAQAQAQAPEALEILASEVSELHFYDFEAGEFVLQHPGVTAQVSAVGEWKYWMQIESDDKVWLGMEVIADVNPVFNFEFLSFIFNQFGPDGSAYSWLLRFRDQKTLERFQEGFLRALWEQLNEIKWTKIKDKERDYVAEAFNDLTMEDVPEELEEEEEEEEALQDEEDEEEEEETKRGIRDGDRAESDSEDEGSDYEKLPADGNTNSQLAVGYKYDRSFVVRGSKIGVFKHTAENDLKFATMISKVETPNGKKLFSPKKVMLHNADGDMILQHDKDPNTLYRMDLEVGKVVDEWKVHEDIPVVTFAPEKKFSQMTGEPTFLGISHNALYRVDPRLGGNKLVDSQLKQYVSKNQFSAIATTEKGYVAVASDKGDIRLFNDDLGKNAKTHIPALGESIFGMDTSADGRWVLATCKTYLLLIDAEQKSGKNEGKLGFERSFAADSKPQPRRLALTPEHVAQFHHETGKGVSFTPAKFNTGEKSEETSIITATGPYIIEWSLKKLLKGAKTPYLIKRYAEEVKADDFKFGTDRNVIVALANEVDMVGKQALKKPTRQSIAGDFRGMSGTPRRSGGGRHSMRERLGRDEIVDSPY